MTKLEKVRADETIERSLKENIQRRSESGDEITRSELNQKQFKSLEFGDVSRVDIRGHRMYL